MFREYSRKITIIIIILNEISGERNVTPKYSLHLGSKLMHPLGSVGGRMLATASAVTIIEIDIEIAIFHGDRMGSKSRSFLFDLHRISLGDGQHV